MKKLKREEGDAGSIPKPAALREGEKKEIVDENERLKSQVEKLINTSRDLDDQMFDRISAALDLYAKRYNIATQLSDFADKIASRIRDPGSASI